MVLKIQDCYQETALLLISVEVIVRNRQRPVLNILVQFLKHVSDKNFEICKGRPSRYQGGPQRILWTIKVTSFSDATAP